MTSEPAERISELAERLKEASPLESPALAREIGQLVETLRPQVATWLRSAESFAALANDPQLRDNLEQVANVARQIQVDQAQLVQMAADIRQLQESGILDQVLKYQRQLAEVVANIRKITGG